jgi:hypothetical protein
MLFELLCAVLIALLFSTAVAFFGYRLLFLLLPIFGFFWGFGLGAQTIQALFGDAFLATVTSWVVGFVVALFAAVLSYLFFYIGVFVLAAAIGYSVVVAILLAIGLDFGFIVWLLGIIGGIALGGVTIFFNLAKPVLIIGTALVGSAAAVGTLMIGVVGAALTNVLQNPVRFVINEGGFVAIVLFILMAAAAMFVQFQQNREYDYEAWENRI